ncbi:MAG: aminotransferase class I/II-fold pyridoxal phosphate-dependent enzyme, partial [Candidatus Altiarchaeales archaeon]|nr:aminotransferase class I/II-fold pyridoxal phosphate-dependent enzyme [Candidatus Altiarchaeales archaeon]
IPYMEKSVRKIVVDRKTLYNNLSRRFRTFKSKANFILIDTSPMKSREFFDRLIDEGIIVRDLGKFDGFSGEYVRISIGTQKENRKLMDVVDSMDHKKS